MAAFRTIAVHPDFENILTLSNAVFLAGGGRSADITKQLLAFARKQTISPRPLDLNDTVESMLNMLRRLIGADIELTWLPANACKS